MISPAVLANAIATYNEYRRPMATAELITRTDAAFTVQFEGPFCRMCCDYDYFEDLLYELDALDEDITAITISDITHDGGETFVVEYTVES